MEKFITKTEKIPFYRNYDIIVAGGGVAGVAAALSAARQGKEVLLIEKSCALGGLATIGHVNFFVPMCNGRGRQIIAGMAEEFLQLAIRYGYNTLPQEWKNGEPETPTNARYMTKFSPWIFAVALTDLLIASNVHILFDTIVTDVIMKDRVCEGVLIQNKAGRSYCTAKVCIDATGDADLLYRAGVPTVQGKNYFTYYGFAATQESCRKAAESGDFSCIYEWASGGTANLYGGNQPPDVPLYSGVDGDEVSDYLIRNQMLVFEKVKKDSAKSRDILSLPMMPQFRTTRRIDGNVTLKETDAYRHFEDSIGAICDFDRRDFLYEIPYGTLVRSGFPNLITAGRSASGEGYAWDILRVIPPAIVSGQAAGLAAVLAIESGKGVDALSVPHLQTAMEKAGNQIHFDDGLIPSNSCFCGKI